MCKHAPFYGAYNFLTLSIMPSIKLPADSKVTIAGLNTSMDDGAMTVIFSNSTSSATGVTKNLTATCVCYAPGCTCEHTFLNVPKVANVKLNATLQCNAYGWGTIGGQNLTVRVGFDTKITNEDPTKAPFAQYIDGNFCEDNCGTSYSLFDPAGLDVAPMVHSSGALFVSIGSTSQVDFCGKGEFVRAELTLTWVTEVKDMLEVPATYNKSAGELTFSVPKNYEILTTEPTLVTAYVRNPDESSAGTRVLLSALTPAGTKLGPTKVAGDVLIATKKVFADLCTELL
jgi:hypothetical protein